jgi:hypothetical protein
LILETGQKWWNVTRRRPAAAPPPPPPPPPLPVIPLRQLAVSGSREPSMTSSEGQAPAGDSSSDAGTMLESIRKSDLKPHKALEFRLVKEPAENGQKWWNVTRRGSSGGT